MVHCRRLRWGPQRRSGIRCLKIVRKQAGFFSAALALVGWCVDRYSTVFASRFEVLTGCLSSTRVVPFAGGGPNLSGPSGSRDSRWQGQ